MKHREWLERVRQEQRNIAPEDTVRNDAVVEGLLIRGDQTLTPVQRIAAILFSLIWAFAAGMSWWAAFDIAHGVASSPALALGVLLIAAIAAGFSYLSLRLMWNAISGSRRKRRHR